MTPPDVLVVGAGHNGLIAAARLARAGLKTLVLERAAAVGGCTSTREIAPGFRCPALAHRVGIHPTVVRRLDLERHGLVRLRTEASVAAVAADGRVLTLWSDPVRAAHAVGAFAQKDAEQYPRFLQGVAAVARVLDSALSDPPPDMDALAPGDLLAGLRIARAFRRLGRADAARLLRWLPMPVADFASEWFESEPLRASAAGAGVFGSFLGPRSAGSTAVLLLLASQGGHPLAPGVAVRGGPGALADALAAAARAAGAAIRTGAAVSRILADARGAAGVALENGEEIRARRVVSSLDPRRTLLGLVDPALVPPALVRRTGHIRMRGTLAKVNYAVTKLPDLPGLRTLQPEERAAALSGCVRLAPGMADIERAFDTAKYGAYSDPPCIELAVPSIADPDLVDGGGHVVSAYVQFAPFALRGRSWDEERERFGDLVTQTIDRHAPGFARAVVARQIITPLDLERDWGLTGGQIFQGELALDQLGPARPLLGWARYHTPIRNLYLCGAGTHPGTGVDGRSGLLAAGAVLTNRPDR